MMASGNDSESGSSYIGTMTVSTSNISLNTAGGSGGGVYQLGGAIDMVNTTVSENQAGSGEQGAGIYLMSGDISLRFTTFAYNRFSGGVGEGAALYLGGVDLYGVADVSSIYAVNNIFYNSTELSSASQIKLDWNQSRPSDSVTSLYNLISDYSVTDAPYMTTGTYVTVQSDYGYNYDTDTNPTSTVGYNIVGHNEASYQYIEDGMYLDDSAEYHANYRTRSYAIMYKESIVYGYGTASIIGSGSDASYSLMVFDYNQSTDKYNIVWDVETVQISMDQRGNNRRGYDEDGNLNDTPSIGAFEPLFYVMVSSKGDDSGLVWIVDENGYSFDSALTSGLTLREAVYWLDTFDRDASLTAGKGPQNNQSLYDPERYVRFDFDDGTFSLAADADNTITLNYGYIWIGAYHQGVQTTKDIVIGAIPEEDLGFRGADETYMAQDDSRRITVSASNTDRHFVIDSGSTAIFNNLTLIDGYASSTARSLAYAMTSWGGSILNFGTLTLNNMYLHDNAAAPPNNTHDGWGGAIYNVGWYGEGGLYIFDTTISDNAVYSIVKSSNNAYGGGIYNDMGDVWIERSNISNNVAYEVASENTGSVAGAGIYSNEGTLTIINTTIAENLLSGAANPGNLNAGSAIYVLGGNLYMYDCTVTNNRTNRKDDVTVSLSSAITVVAYELDGEYYAGTLDLVDNIIYNNVTEIYTSPHTREVTDIYFDEYVTVEHTWNNIVGKSLADNYIFNTSETPDPSPNNKDNIVGDLFGYIAQVRLDDTMKYNGGMTQNYRVLDNSVAYGAGTALPTETPDGSDLTHVTTDQRGLERDIADRYGNTTQNIGSYESLTMVYVNSNADVSTVYDAGYNFVLNRPGWESDDVTFRDALFWADYNALISVSVQMASENWSGEVIEQTNGAWNISTGVDINGEIHYYFYIDNISNGRVVFTDYASGVTVYNYYVGETDGVRVLYDDASGDYSYIDSESSTSIALTRVDVSSSDVVITQQDEYNVYSYRGDNQLLAGKILIAEFNSATGQTEFFYFIETQTAAVVDVQVCEMKEPSSIYVDSMTQGRLVDSGDAVGASDYSYYAGEYQGANVEYDAVNDQYYYMDYFDPDNPVRVDLERTLVSSDNVTTSIDDKGFATYTETSTGQVLVAEYNGGYRYFYFKQESDAGSGDYDQVIAVNECRLRYSVTPESTQRITTSEDNYFYNIDNVSEGKVVYEEQTTAYETVYKYYIGEDDGVNVLYDELTGQYSYIDPSNQQIVELTPILIDASDVTTSTVTTADGEYNVYTYNSKELVAQYNSTTRQTEYFYFTETDSGTVVNVDVCELTESACIYIDAETQGRLLAEEPETDVSDYSYYAGEVNGEIVQYDTATGEYYYMDGNDRIELQRQMVAAGFVTEAVDVNGFSTYTETSSGQVLIAEYNEGIVEYFYLNEEVVPGSGSFNKTIAVSSCRLVNDVAAESQDRNGAPGRADSYYIDNISDGKVIYEDNTTTDYMFRYYVGEDGGEVISVYKYYVGETDGVEVNYDADTDTYSYYDDGTSQDVELTLVEVNSEDVTRVQTEEYAYYIYSGTDEALYTTGSEGVTTAKQLVADYNEETGKTEFYYFTETLDSTVIVDVESCELVEAANIYVDEVSRGRLVDGGESDYASNYLYYAGESSGVMVEFDAAGYYYIDDSDPDNPVRVDLERTDVDAADVTTYENEENGYNTYVRTSDGKVLIAENDDGTVEFFLLQQESVAGSGDFDVDVAVTECRLTTHVYRDNLVYTGLATDVDTNFYVDNITDGRVLYAQDTPTQTEPVQDGVNVFYDPVTGQYTYTTLDNTEVVELTQNFVDQTDVLRTTDGESSIYTYNGDDPELIGKQLVAQLNTETGYTQFFYFTETLNTDAAINVNFCDLADPASIFVDSTTNGRLMDMGESEGVSDYGYYAGQADGEIVEYDVETGSYYYLDDGGLRVDLYQQQVDASSVVEFYDSKGYTYYVEDVTAQVLIAADDGTGTVEYFYLSTDMGGSDVIGVVTCRMTSIAALDTHEFQADFGVNLTLDAAREDRAVYIYNDAFIDPVNVGLNHLNIVNGYVSGSGGAIWSFENLVLQDMVINGNVANGGSGGAIYSQSGFLEIYNSDISFNTADSGGAIYQAANRLYITDSLFEGNMAIDGNGGALTSFGTVTTIERTTFYDNEASMSGGGLYISSSSSADYESTIVNSTISNNEAGLNGGGISFVGGGNLTLNFTTVANNISGTANTNIRFGGGIYQSAGTLALYNSIVGQNWQGGNMSDIYLTSYLDPTSEFNVIGQTNSSLFSSLTTSNRIYDADLGAYYDVTDPTSYPYQLYISGVADDNGYDQGAYADLTYAVGTYMESVLGQVEMYANGELNHDVLTVYVYNSGNNAVQDFGDITVGPGTNLNIDQRGYSRVGVAVTVGSFQKYIDNFYYDDKTGDGNFNNAANWYYYEGIQKVYLDNFFADYSLNFNAEGYSFNVMVDLSTEVGGNWTISEKSDLVVGDDVVFTIFYDSADQVADSFTGRLIVEGTGAAVVDGNLLILGPGLVSDQGSITVNALGNIATGSNSNYDFFSSLDLLESGTLNLNTLNYASLNLFYLAATSTVSYNYDYNQEESDVGYQTLIEVSQSGYGILSLSGTMQKIAETDLLVSELHVNDSISQFDSLEITSAFSGGNATVLVTGDWTYYGASFDAANTDFVFAGSAIQTLDNSTVTFAVNSITLDNSDGLNVLSEVEAGSVNLTDGMIFINDSDFTVTGDIYGASGVDDRYFVIGGSGYLIRPVDFGETKDFWVGFLPDGETEYKWSQVVLTNNDGLLNDFKVRAINSTNYLHTPPEIPDEDANSSVSIIWDVETDSTDYTFEVNDVSLSAMSGYYNSSLAVIHHWNGASWDMSPNDQTEAGYFYLGHDLIVVNTNSDLSIYLDDPNDPALISLRGAIDAINAGLGPSVVIFDDEVFNLDTGVSTITMNSGLGAMLISQSMSIVGLLDGDTTFVTIDGNANSTPIFVIEAAASENITVDLGRLILTNAGDVSGSGYSGSAIANMEDLRLSDMTLYLNQGVAINNQGSILVKQESYLAIDQTSQGNTFQYDLDSTLRYIYVDDGSESASGLYITDPGSEFNTAKVWSSGMLNNLELGDNVTLELSQDVALRNDLILASSSNLAIRDNYLTISGDADINGSLLLGNGTTTVVGDFDATSGLVSFEDGLTLYSGTLYLGGDVVSLGSYVEGVSTYSSSLLDGESSFEAGESTVIYNGTSDQYIAGATYYNLTIATKSDDDVVSEAIIDLQTTVNVLNDFLVESGVELTLATAEISTYSPVLDVQGEFIVLGSLDAGSATIYIAAEAAELGEFTAGTSTVVYNGVIDQTIDANTQTETDKYNYYNLVVSGEEYNIKTITSALKIENDFTIEMAEVVISNNGATIAVGGDLTIDGTGTLNLGSNTISNNIEVARDTSIGLDGILNIISGYFDSNGEFTNLGEMTLTEDATLLLAGYHSSLGSFNADAGLVVYDGIENNGQIPYIYAADYWNLQISNGNKQLAGEVNVLNNFTFSSSGDVTGTARLILGAYDITIENNVYGYHVPVEDVDTSERFFVAEGRGSVYRPLEADTDMIYIIGAYDSSTGTYLYSSITINSSVARYFGVSAFSSVTTNGQYNGTEVSNLDDDITMTWNFSSTIDGYFDFTLNQDQNGSYITNAVGDNFSTSLAMVRNYVDGSWYEVSNPMYNLGAYFIGNGVSAGGLVVTNTNDVLYGEDGYYGSLRWAITAANAHEGIDIITFDSEVFSEAQYIYLVNGQLTITDDVVIEGVGANTLFVVADAASGEEAASVPVFTVSDGESTTRITVSVSGMTLYANGPVLSEGSVIVNHELLTLTNVSIDRYDENISMNYSYGAIFNSQYGVLEMYDSAIVNHTENAGLKNQGEAALYNVTIVNNFYGVYIDSADPGNVLVDPYTSLNNVTVAQNSRYGVYLGAGDLFATSTIFAENDSYDYYYSGTGVLLDGGYNLVETQNGSWTSTETNFFSDDPSTNNILGPQQYLFDGELGDNGGYTPTLALDLRSDAVNAGTGDQTADQRGYLINGQIDIGAYEANGFVAWNENSGEYYSTIESAVFMADDFDSIKLIDSRIVTESVNIDKNLNLSGSGDNSLVVVNDGSNWAFVVDDSSSSNTVAVRLYDFAIEGYFTGLVQGENVYTGAGIYNAESLQLIGMTLSNLRSDSGAALYNAADAYVNAENIVVFNNISTINGGAVYNEGSLDITNSTFARNSAAGSGGAIYSVNPSIEYQTSLNISNSTFVANVAGSDGGAIYNSAGLHLVNSTLAENEAVDGGAIYNTGQLDLINVTIAYNTASNEAGGLYQAAGLLYSVNTILAENTAAGYNDYYEAGGDHIDYGYNILGESNTIWNADGDLYYDASVDGLLFGPEGLQDNGGWSYTLALADYNSIAVNAGIYVAETEYDQRGYMRHTTDIGAYEFEGYVASYVYYVDGDSYDYYYTGYAITIQDAIAMVDGGDVGSYVSLMNTRILETNIKIENGISVDLRGNELGGTTISSGGMDRVFLVESGGSLQLSRVTLADGYAVNSIMPDRAYATGLGGGIFVYAGGSLSLNEVSIIDSHADFAGGAIFIDGGTFELEDATLYDAWGTVTIENSLIYNNDTYYYGGGIANYGSLTMTNSTVAGNTAYEIGGGIFAYGWNSLATPGSVLGDTTLTNVTIAFNQAFTAGGGLFFDTGTFTSSSSLYAENISGADGSVADDYYYNGTGTLVDDGYNLVEEQNGTYSTASPNFFGGVASDIIGQQTNLFVGSTPSDNGGWTMSLALHQDSNAIDAGDPGGETTDQRGFGANSTRDIGAYEYLGIVATNGDNEYSSIQSAINDASAGDTISLVGARIVESDIYISMNLTITGESQTFIDANSAGRIFYIAAESVSLNSMSLIDGATMVTSGDVSQQAEGVGGAIFNSGSLALNNVSIYDSYAQLAGGAIFSVGDLTISATDRTEILYYSEFAFNRAGLSGGAISVNGGPTSAALTITGSVMFRQNSAEQGGAINAAGPISLAGVNVVTVNHNGFNNTLLFESNYAEYGGAISINDVYGETSISKVTLDSNTAYSNGGGISIINSGNTTITDSYAYYNLAFGSGGAVSAVNSGNLDIIGTSASYAEFENNRAYADGGAVHFSMSGTLTITGEEGDTSSGYWIAYNDAGNDGGAVYAADSAGVMVSYYSVLAFNSSSNDGGGMYVSNVGSLTFNFDNIIYGNTAGRFGGGIYVSDVDDVYSQDVLIVMYNEAGESGGGIYAVNSVLNLNWLEVSYNSAYMAGGGIYLLDSKLTLTDAEISTNSAEFGGGIYAIDSKIDISSSSINNGYVTADGAGIYAYNTDVSLLNSTVAYNQASNNGGGIYIENGDLSLHFVTMAYNDAYDYVSGIAGDGAAIYMVNGDLSSKSSMIYNLESGSSYLAADTQVYLANSTISTFNYSIFSHAYRSVVPAFSGTGNIIGSTSQYAQYIQDNLYLDTELKYHANYRTTALAVLFSDSIAYKAGGSHEGIKYDQRGNLRSTTIGAFEPLYYVTVNSKGDDERMHNVIYDVDTGNGYFDLALENGLTLREAVYWMDSYLPEYSTNAGLAVDTDRYIKFDETVFGITELNPDWNPDDPTSTEPKYITADNTIELRYGGIKIVNDVMISITPDGTFDADNIYRAQDDPTRVTVSGMSIYQIFLVDPGATAVISNLTLTEGGGYDYFYTSASYGNGGAINNQGDLTLNNVVVSNSESGYNYYGGGIYNTGTLTLNDSTVTGNQSEYLYGSSGGGIYNSYGTVTINRSLITGNSAFGTDAESASGSGGGIYSVGGELTIISSTISENSVYGDMLEGTASLGSGIYVNGSELNIYSSTIMNNTGYGENGYAVYVFGTNTVIQNTIIANNTSSIITEDGTTVVNRDIATLTGSVTDSNNIIGYYSGHDFSDPDSNNITGDLYGNITNLNISNTLAYNGGKTMNYRVYGNSVAVNAGITLADYNYDQRGVARDIADRYGDTTPTIGAYEMLTSIVVTTDADAVLGDDIGFNFTNNANGWEDNLRSALYLADTNATVELDVDGNKPTIKLVGGELAISTGLTLVAGNAPVTIDAKEQSRIFNIQANAYESSMMVEISNFILQNGVTDSNGGAISSSENLYLTNVSILDSSADGKGGAIYSTGNQLVLDTVTIDGSSSDSGAVYVSGSQLEIVDSVFSDNTAVRNGAAVYAESSEVVIESSEFTGNSAGGSGGAVFLNNSYATIDATTFMDNSADSYGGGLFQLGGYVEITMSTFGNNDAGESGGGIYVLSGSLDMVNSTISGNEAKETGGGIYFDGVRLDLNFVTIANNSIINTTDGAGLYFDNGILNMYNTILANNWQGNDTSRAYDFYRVAGLARAWYSIIGDSNYAAIYNESSVIRGDGNGIVQNLFLDTELQYTGGPTPTLYVAQSSVAVGAGLAGTGVTISQNGKTRDLTAPTIGAYESGVTEYVFTNATGDGDVTNYLNWISVDGYDTHPDVDFKAYDVRYIFDSAYTDATLHGDWTISSRAYITVEADTVFTIAADGALDAYVTVSGNEAPIEVYGTLVLNTADKNISELSLFTLAVGSTVEYGYSVSSQTVRADDYYNLVLSGGQAKKANGDITAETITVENDTALDMRSNDLIVAYEIDGGGSISNGGEVYLGVEDSSFDLSANVGGSFISVLTDLNMAGGSLSADNILFADTVSTISGTYNLVSATSITGLSGADSYWIDVAADSTLEFDMGRNDITVDGGADGDFNLSRITVGDNGFIEFTTRGDFTFDHITGTQDSGILGTIVANSRDIYLNDAIFDTASLELNNTGIINLLNFTIRNDIAFGGKVVLLGDATVTSTEGDVRFTGQVDGQGYSLLINAESGDAAIGKTSNVNNLTVLANSVSVLDKLVISGDLSLPATMLIDDTTIVAGGTALFDGDISSPDQAFSFDVTADTVIFNGDIGTVADPLMNLTITADTVDAEPGDVALQGNLTVRNEFGDSFKDSTLYLLGGSMQYLYVDGFWNFDVIEMRNVVGAQTSNGVLIVNDFNFSNDAGNFYLNDNNLIINNDLTFTDQWFVTNGKGLLFRTIGVDGTQTYNLGVNDEQRVTLYVEGDIGSLVGFSVFKGVTANGTPGGLPSDNLKDTAGFTIVSQFDPIGGNPDASAKIVGFSAAESLTVWDASLEGDNFGLGDNINYYTYANGKWTLNKGSMVVGYVTDQLHTYYFDNIEMTPGRQYISLAVPRANLGLNEVYVLGLNGTQQDDRVDGVEPIKYPAPNDGYAGFFFYEGGSLDSLTRVERFPGVINEPAGRADLLEPEGFRFISLDGGSFQGMPNGEYTFPQEEVVLPVIEEEEEDYFEEFLELGQLDINELFGKHEICKTDLDRMFDELVG